MRKNGGRVLEILRLYDRGVPSGEIASRTGCTVQNVCNAVRRHRPVWSGLVSPLSPRAQAWLVAEAKRAGVSACVMARALLIDAIEDAIEEKAHDRTA